MSASDEQALRHFTGALSHRTRGIRRCPVSGRGSLRRVGALGSVSYGAVGPVLHHGPRQCNDPPVWRQSESRTHSLRPLRPLNTSLGGFDSHCVPSLSPTMSESTTTAGNISSSQQYDPLASPPAVIQLLLAYAPSTGALEVGTSISMLFLGIASLQVWNYYRNFAGDPLLPKVLVAILFSMDILHSVLFMHLTYHYTINSFVEALRAGDPLLLIVTPWSLQAAIIVGAGVILLVQLYYCHRIRLVTDNQILVLACLVVVGARFALNIALTVTSIEHTSITVVTSYTFRWETISTMSVGAASDLFIAGCMCVGLHQRRTGFSRSDRLVDRLISYTIASGAATSILSVVMLVIYITMPTTCKPHHLIVAPHTAVTDFPRLGIPSCSDQGPYGVWRVY
ncbi:hypothetical protein EXIGLDRAFT_76671 [Exidia glandulosa HHB12029]|uniref:DUF6534 domain-containing protein n=1 Tax=Exidia glandulosa HHB12029 TaxID=1314781 RepID=A0A165HRA3_EXIGL|nr:hypothetical protein EXIGLDRAFT_76671 [Exidia glandulosa HHB12029]